MAKKRIVETDKAGAKRKGTLTFLPMLWAITAPNVSITREQMAVMLYRYTEYSEFDISSVEGTSVKEFTDSVSISNYALGPIQWAINSGILSGNADGSFAPAADAIRVQAAKLIAILS